MNKDIFAVILDEIKTNSAKYSIIATTASVIVGVIVAIMVIKGVMNKTKGN